MKIAGPPPKQSFDPYTKEDEKRPPKCYKFYLNGKAYLWDRVRPLVIKYKKEDRYFKEALESENLTWLQVYLCIGTCEKIIEEIKPM